MLWRKSIWEASHYKINEVRKRRISNCIRQDTDFWGAIKGEELKIQAARGKQEENMHRFSAQNVKQAEDE